MCCAPTPSWRLGGPLNERDRASNIYKSRRMISMQRNIYKFAIHSKCINLGIKCLSLSVFYALGAKHLTIKLEDTGSRKPERQQHRFRKRWLKGCTEYSVRGIYMGLWSFSVQSRSRTVFIQCLTATLVRRQGKFCLAFFGPRVA